FSIHASPHDLHSFPTRRSSDLAGELKHFQGQDLDVHRKIAYLGEKTFRWDCGSETHETKFNYTMNPAASQLLQIFEGLARQQEEDRKSTRLNSSHGSISYAVFC